MTHANKPHFLESTPVTVNREPASDELARLILEALLVETFGPAGAYETNAVVEVTFPAAS